MTDHLTAAQLSALADGELAGDELNDVKEHIDECLPCARSAVDEWLLKGAVARAGRRYDAPADLSDRMAILVAKQASPKARRPDGAPALSRSPKTGVAFAVWAAAAAVLLVLGGWGNTDTLIPNNDIGRLMTNDYYANNDYWHDDTSDGPVTATVTVDGHDVPVKGKAWVLAVPPKFVPFAECITTLYDTAMETWEKSRSGSLPERPVSFTRHIYPILRRLAGYTWLNANAAEHHGPNTNNYFADVDSPLFRLLSSAFDEDARRKRKYIFERLRPPGLVAETPHAADTPESAKFANYAFMPQMSGDGGEPTTAEDPTTAENPVANPGPQDQVYDCKTGKNWDVSKPTTQPGGSYITWLTLSERQYSDMKLWSEGKFEADWQGVPQQVPLEKLPVADQPDALSRAALEPCVGAPFFPGIEITYIATRPDTWSGPCRVNQSFRPGDITSHMALPWQSDFSECATNWWPTARPDDVVSQESFEALLREHTPADQGMLDRVLATRVPWARGIPVTSPGRDNAMVKAWSHFGFVVPREAGPGQIAYVETERSPYFGSSERDFFYYSGVTRGSEIPSG